jgi:hypothetical protein
MRIGKLRRGQYSQSEDRLYQWLREPRHNVFGTQFTLDNCVSTKILERMHAELRLPCYRLLQDPLCTELQRKLCRRIK